MNEKEIRFSAETDFLKGATLKSISKKYKKSEYIINTWYTRGGWAKKRKDLRKKLEDDREEFLRKEFKKELQKTTKYCIKGNVHYAALVYKRAKKMNEDNYDQRKIKVDVGIFEKILSSQQRVVSVIDDK